MKGDSQTLDGLLKHLRNWRSQEGPFHETMLVQLPDGRKAYHLSLSIRFRRFERCHRRHSGDSPQVSARVSKDLLAQKYLTATGPRPCRCNSLFLDTMQSLPFSFGIISHWIRHDSLLKESQPKMADFMLIFRSTLCCFGGVNGSWVYLHMPVSCR